MTILNFPASPAVGATYEANGITYVWTGTHWDSVGGSGGSGGSGNVIEAGADYVIFEGPDGSKVLQCWGENGAGVPAGNVNITYPKAFASSPGLAVTPVSTDGSYVFVFRGTTIGTTGATIARAAMQVSGSGGWVSTAVPFFWNAIGIPA